MIIDYISGIGKAVELCDKFSEVTVEVFFEGGDRANSDLAFFVWSDIYRNNFRQLKGCIELCRLVKPVSLGDYERTFYEGASSLQDPGKINNLRTFRFNMDCIRIGFTGMADEIASVPSHN